METPGASKDILAFKRPPVIEVALAVQFAPDTLNEFNVLSLRESVKDRFPGLEKYPPRPPIGEGFVPQQQPQVQFEMIITPPMPLYWFVSQDSTMLIQVQQDRVAFNWRRTAPEDEYPLYETLREEFVPMLNAIQELVAAEGRELSCNWCEVTYINHIQPMPPAHEVSRLLTDYRPPSLPDFEDVNLVTRFRIDDANGEPRGRMSATLASATRIEGNEPIWVYTLTTRMLAREGTLEGAIASLDEAREYAGKGFEELTTDQMQALWERVS